MLPTRACPLQMHSPNVLACVGARSSQVLEADQRRLGPGAKQWPQLSYALMAEATEPSQDSEDILQGAAASASPAALQGQQREQEGRSAQVYELLPVEPETFDCGWAQRWWWSWCACLCICACVCLCICVSVCVGVLGYLCECVCVHV